MLNKETANKIRVLIKKHSGDNALLIYEAIQEGLLDDVLDLIYESGATISPDIVRTQLEKYYNVNSIKDKRKIDYMINKNQYLIVKTMFATNK